jgi:transcriptional regulator with XRE-family HTH domain
VIERNTQYISDFGANLKKWRKSKGLSQEQLAFDSNIPISQIGRIERGEINTTLSTLYTLSKALNITVPELVKF